MALQEVLTTFMGPLIGGSAPCIQNATMNATTTATSSFPSIIPSDIASLITMLFSFGALRDWFKLFVIGSFLETARRFAFSAYYNFTNSFFITATFDEDDASYQWVMMWLSNQPTWSKAREVQITTRRFGLDNDRDYRDEDSRNNTHKISLLPTVSNTHTIWYKHRPIWITRTRTETGYYGRKEETLSIQILARTHRVLNHLLQEAKDQYLASRQHLISIYTSDIQGSWRCVATRPKRPLRSIVLDPGMKDLLMDDAKDFLDSKPWYQDRGIPFRRGYLLYGAPGSGKTSIIHSIAGELGLDVYIVSLSRAGMDDSTLSELISELPERCIALMEDIDAAFHHGLNRDEGSPASPTQGGSDGSSPQGTRAPAPVSSSRLSLSGLLNALDGVGAQEGRILFATTNKYTSLDPALCRPGRMDLHIEFKLASKFQARELYRCFYMPTVDSESEKKDGSGNEKKEPPVESSPDPLVDLETSSQASSEDAETLVSPSPMLPSKEPPSPALSSVFQNHLHNERAPKLSPEQVSRLAQTFADVLPEREFSMASLQGYLMTYKTRPFEAAKNLGEWVEKERADALKKAAQTKSSAPSSSEGTGESGKTTEPQSSEGEASETTKVDSAET